MENSNKGSSIVGPMWFLLLIGIISFIFFFGWAIVESQSCRALQTCTGAGIIQGLAIMAISIPAILISTIVALISQTNRKKKLLYISHSHKLLVRTGITVVVLIILFQSRIFMGMFNYMRDFVETIFGF